MRQHAVSCLAGSVIVGRISFMFAPEQCSRELSLRATAPVFHAVWRLRLPCIARASRRVYYPLERLVTGLLACGSGRSASRVIGTASRSLSAPRRVGLRIVLFEACSAFTRVITAHATSRHMQCSKTLIDHRVGGRE